VSSLNKLTDAEYYAYIEDRGHVLRREEDGEVDIFYLDYDCHNGPGCVRCHESWCHHCRDEVDMCEKAGAELFPLTVEDAKVGKAA
jgi:hypothetical protein